MSFRKLVTGRIAWRRAKNWAKKPASKISNVQSHPLPILIFHPWDETSAAKRAVFLRDIFVANVPKEICTRKPVPFSLIVVINLLNRFVIFDVCACLWSAL